MKKEQPQPAVIGASGEYLVLSHLLRLNLIAGTAPENTKDYDLIVLNKDGTTSFPIQVKTTIDKKDGWILKDKHEKIIKNLIFIFVAMNSNSKDSEIYVLNSELVANLVKQSHEIWLKLPGLNGKKHQSTSMRHLMRDYSKISGLRKIQDKEKYLNKSDIEFIDKYSDGWINEYKDRWDLLSIK